MNKALMYVEYATEKTLGIAEMHNGQKRWYNYKGTKSREEMKNKIKNLNKGDLLEVELSPESNEQDMKYVDFTVKEASSIPKSTESHNYKDEYIGFEELFKQMHDLTEGEYSIITEILDHDREKNFCLVKATIKGKGEFKVIEAHGDASPDNVSSSIRPHYVRMAETRAIARAIRFYLGISTTAQEELQ